MSAERRRTMTAAEAQTFLALHGLDYLDLFALVVAYAGRFPDAGIKGESDRVTVWIRTAAGARRRAEKRARKGAA